jgi:hypothetical protein
MKTRVRLASVLTLALPLLSAHAEQCVKVSVFHMTPPGGVEKAGWKYMPAGPAFVSMQLGTEMAKAKGDALGTKLGAGAGLLIGTPLGLLASGPLTLAGGLLVGGATAGGLTYFGHTFGAQWFSQREREAVRRALMDPLLQRAFTDDALLRLQNEAQGLAQANAPTGPIEDSPLALLTKKINSIFEEAGRADRATSADALANWLLNTEFRECTMDLSERQALAQALAAPRSAEASQIAVDFDAERAVH